MQRTYDATSVFDKIEVLINNLGYGDLSIGMCFGLSNVARHYFAEGYKGAMKLKRLFAFIDSYDVSTLNKNILAVEEIRKEITARKKSNLIKEYRGRLRNVATYDYSNTFNIRTEHVRQLIDKVIKNKFSDTSSNERQQFVEAIYQLKFCNIKNAILPTSKIENIYSLIENDLIEAHVDYLAQRHLKQFIKNKLRKNHDQPKDYFLKLRPFLQSIAVYQRPDLYNFLLEENIKNYLADGQSTLAYFPLLSVDNDISAVDSGNSFGSFTHRTLKQYFCLIQNAAKNHALTILHLHCRSINHGIEVTYCPSEKIWCYADNTVVEVFLDNHLNGLVDLVFKTDGKSDYFSQLAFEIYAKDNDVDKLKQIMEEFVELKQWSVIHNVSENILQKDTKQILPYFASISTNEILVKQLAEKSLATREDELVLFARIIILMGLYGGIIHSPSLILSGLLCSLVAVDGYLVGDKYFKIAEKKSSHDRIISEHWKMNSFFNALKDQKAHQDRFPSIDRTKKISDANENEGSKKTVLFSIFKTQLFTKEHLLFCQIRETWKRAWTINQTPLLKKSLSRMNDTFFTYSNSKELALFDQHFNNINELLCLTGFLRKADEFKERLTEVKNEMVLLLADSGFKQIASRELEAALTKISKQLSLYDKERLNTKTDVTPVISSLRKQE